tara:strand:- start:182 stop:388 length:207 start_codon:yes stop_codon:yes gene_type:complete
MPLGSVAADGVTNACSLEFELRLPFAKTGDRFLGKSIESADAGDVRAGTEALAATARAKDEDVGMPSP